MAFFLLFLHLSFPEPYIFQRRGIMRASSGGWPCASHCIGVLWLIELAKWKMKCQQGHAVQQAVSVCLREKREMNTHDRLPDFSRSLLLAICQKDFSRPMEDDGLNWLAGLHRRTVSGPRREIKMFYRTRLHLNNHRWTSNLSFWQGWKMTRKSWWNQHLAKNVFMFVTLSSWQFFQLLWLKVFESQEKYLTPSATFKTTAQNIAQSVWHPREAKCHAHLQDDKR